MENRYTQNKARYWWAVCYPENMIEDWKSQLDDVLQLPYAYCVHDKDVTSDRGEDRKEHVHIMIAFANTTTYKNAFNTFMKLSASGKQCMNKCESIVSIRYAYDYLIHDTDSCRKAGKHEYDKSERICGNNFDIGSYEQLSQTEQDELFNEICDFITTSCLENFADLHVYYRDREDYLKYQHVLRGHRGYFVELCKGIYLKKKRFEELDLQKSENRKKKIERDRMFMAELNEEINGKNEK